jgi:hypothetical protein
VDIGAFEAQVSVDDIPDQATSEDTPASIHFQRGRRVEHHFGHSYLFEYDPGAKQCSEY